MIQKASKIFFLIKPSELIDLALERFDIIKDSSIRATRTVWFYNNPEDMACCFGWSIIHTEFGIVSNEKYPFPDIFNESISGKLMFLMNISFGYIGEGLDYLNLEKPKKLSEWIRVSCLHENPEMFREEIAGISDELKQFEL